MRLPIRNKSDRPITVWMEPVCNEFEVPPGGEAIVRIEEGYLDSIEFSDAWLTINDNSACASVEVVSEQDMRVDDALGLAAAWLHRFGASAEAKLIGRVVEDLEPTAGYFNARKQVFIAFHDGFESGRRRVAISTAPDDENLAACHRAGVMAARLNRKARRNCSFPGFGTGPLDTDTVRSAFARALG